MSGEFKELAARSFQQLAVDVCFHTQNAESHWCPCCSRGERSYEALVRATQQQIVAELLKQARTDICIEINDADIVRRTKEILDGK